MAVSREQILDAVRMMSPAERYDLIEDIRQLLDDSEPSPELLAELKRRVDAIDRGEDDLVSADDVVAELRNELRKQRRRRAS